MLKHFSPISGIASFYDQFIATAGYDNRIILWNAKDNSPIAIGNHDHLVNQCEFSPCGKYLISSSSDHTSRIWLMPQMKLIAVLAKHTDDVEYATFLGKKPLVATASRDCNIRVFNLERSLIKTMSGHQADVISVQWQCRSNKLISNSDDGTVRTWDIESGLEIDQLNNSGIQTDALAISDNDIIYAGDDAGNIHVLSKKIKTTLVAHAAGIKKIVINAKKLISIAYDRKARLWNILSNGLLELDKEFPLLNIIWARSCTFFKENSIAFATFGDAYALYNYQTETWETDHIRQTNGINAMSTCQSGLLTIGDSGTLKLNHHPIQQLPSLCNFLIQCGKILLTGGQTGEVFDAESGQIIYRHKSPLNSAVQFLYEENEYIVIGSYTGEALIFKYTSAGIVFNRLITLHNNAIKSLAVSQHILFSVCATGAAAWYDLKNNKHLMHIETAHSKIANGCVALENRLFASISRDLLLRIWDGNTFSLKLEIGTPHTNSIKCIATDDSFRYLATGSYTGLLAIFDRQKNNWKTQKLTTAGISSINFDIKKNQFIASSYDGNCYFVNQ